jgi:hypothetical protein
MDGLMFITRSRVKVMSLRIDANSRFCCGEVAGRSGTSWKCISSKVSSGLIKGGRQETRKRGGPPTLPVAYVLSDANLTFLDT